MGAPDTTLDAELKQLRRAVALAGVRAWSFDSLHSEVHWSPSCRELYGLGAEELVTADGLVAFFEEDDRERISVLVRAAVRVGAAFECEGTILRRGGGRRQLTFRGEPLRDDDGALAGYHGVIIDRTEHDEREAKLRQLAMLAERTRNGVVVADRHGRVEWVSAGFTRLTGYVLAEVVGKVVGAVLQGPASDPAVRELMHDRVARLEPFHVELVNYTKGGVPYWVDIDVQPVVDEAGVVTHFMGIQTDISERKAAESAQGEARALLERSLSLLQVVLGSTDHAVIATDATGAITLFNAGAERMLGWTAAEVVGQHNASVLHLDAEVRDHAAALTRSLGEPVAGFDALVALARRGGRDVREWTFVRKDRSTLTVSLTSTALRGEGGVLQGFVGVASDVTAAHAVEWAKRDALERLTKLGQNLPGVAYQYQLFADGRSCFPWASEGMRDIYGVSPQDVLTDAGPVFAVVHPDDLPWIAASITRSAAELSRWTAEYRVRRPDGSVRWVLGNATPERQPDGSVLWHGYIFDNTERKAFESELVRAREAALDASQVKSQFLANMSHEIRTPLNGILGMTQLLLESEVTAEQRIFLDATRTSGQLLLALINDILDLAKVESGRLELEVLAFSPRELLTRVVQTLSVRAEERGLILGLEVDAAVPALLKGDPTRLLQVLINLAGNGVKFTAKGSVRLAMTRTAQGLLRIAVRDTGIGIAPERLARLFQPFTQVDGTISRRYGGTGLGLTISRKLVERMGGTLGVESVEGQGACFTVELPLPEAASGAVVALSSPAAPTRPSLPRSVLVAEDNAINALVVRTLLERDGHRVVHVTTGLAAVEAVARGYFDLVLMDIQMPELDGLEATLRIRDGERARGGHVPICALTANAMKGDVERCLAAGMDDYLTKPVELAVLRQKLAAHPPRPAPAGRGLG